MMINRREFLKLGATAVGGLTTVGAVNHFKEVGPPDNKNRASSQEETAHVVICPSMGCHQNCAITAYVRDGRVVRMGPPDFPGIPEFNHICLKGLNSWQLPYNPNRLNYPMRRVGPRGSGEWERISWDEAFDAIAGQLSEIRDEYGPQAVMMSGYGSSSVPLGGINAGWMTQRFSNLFGCTEFAGWLVDGGPFMAAFDQYGFFYHGLNDPRDWKNTRLMLNFGSNPAETTLREMKLMLEAKDQGMKLVQISVNYDSTAAKADEWIPIEAATDGALAMSMLHIIFREGLHDIPYLTYSTVGPLLVRLDTGKFLRGNDISPELDKELYVVWDSTSNGPAPMPPHVHALPGLEPVLDGKFEVNGIACATSFNLLVAEAEKFPPEEAARITGVPAERIESLALEYATTKPSVVRVGVGMTRYYYGDLTSRALYTLGAVTGNVGIIGGGAGEEPGGFNPLLNQGPVCAPNEKRARRIHVSEGYRTVLEGDPWPVKALMVFANNPLNCVPTYRSWIDEILPKLDLVVVTDIVQSATAQYADIILPGTSIFERIDIMTKNGYAILNDRPIEPLFERKSDIDIMRGLADRLGFGEYFTETEDDHIRTMLQHPTLEGVTLERLRAEGGLVFGNGPMEPQIAFADQEYWTASGRIEFYAEHLAEVGQGLPTYMGGASHVKDSEYGQKYPLRFLTCHRRYWVHSQSHYPLTKQMNLEPTLKINPQDAKKRGLEQSELARAFNDRGEMVIKVELNPGIRPGTVWIEHGFHPDEFISGFYQDLCRPQNMPTEDMLNPAWIIYWQMFKDFTDHTETALGMPFGISDQIFDVLCQVEKFTG